MEYFLHILILIGVYTILSVSLNLVSGYTGLISIAHAAFYGVGAYVAALMALKLNSPFLANIICAIIISGSISALACIPSLRIRDDFFIIATFSFQVIAFNVMNNWVCLTNGPMGISGIPQPVIFGLRITSHFGFLILVFLFCALALGIVRVIVKSPLGRILKAIREDEVLTQAAGKNVAGYKVLVFVIGAGMAAVAGVLYAYYISFIDPTSFSVMESIFIISLVIIGGAGSLWGPVVGTALLVVLPEILRFIGLPSSIAANLRQIIYGGLLVGFMVWRPRGLLGDYAFKIRGMKSE
jgi:branched-chain amino acid transport system permease protein